MEPNEYYCQKPIKKHHRLLRLFNMPKINLAKPVANALTKFRVKDIIKIERKQFVVKFFLVEFGNNLHDLLFVGFVNLDIVDASIALVYVAIQHRVSFNMLLHKFFNFLKSLVCMEDHQFITKLH